MRKLTALVVPAATEGGSTWSELKLPRPWQAVLASFGAPSPLPLQAEAFAAGRVTEGRRNLIVSAPTNTGKTLIGTAVLLHALKRGRRAVLLEPLRALAHERFVQASQQTPALRKFLGHEPGVVISTGDYRISGEAMTAAPPLGGELVVTTPERLDAILRNPAHAGWVAQIGAICVDEAHLVGNPRRGPTIEFVVTSLLTNPFPPRVVLLSASLGETADAERWLAPCDVVRSDSRAGRLITEVWDIGDEEVDQIIVDHARAVLEGRDSQIIIFVHTTASADRLAHRLDQEFGFTNRDVVAAFHARMSSDRRLAVQQRLMGGSCRCVVATTALALGVNLPATHIVIRDTRFGPAHELSPGEILQMAGRAGRGSRSGHAVVLVRRSDRRDAVALADALGRPSLPTLTSALRQRAEGTSLRPTQLATWTAALLARTGEVGLSEQSIASFMANSLGGPIEVRSLRSALEWLADERRRLGYRTDTGEWKLTSLGLRATRAMLPLPTAGAVTALLRDIMSISEGHTLLGRWTALDYLLVLHILHGDGVRLRRYSRSLRAEVDDWMAAHAENAPALFPWIAGAGSSNASELLGSLGIGDRTNSSPPSESAYTAAFHALLLLERASGVAAQDVERHWKCSGLEAVEERWRDELLWLLAGWSELLDIRVFYSHLTRLGRTQDEIKEAKAALRTMRRVAMTLREDLRYCSVLGPMLRHLRHEAGSGPRVGPQTVRRLEHQGLTTLEQLSALDEDQLVALGIRRDLASQVAAYVRSQVKGDSAVQSSG